MTEIQTAPMPPRELDSTQFDRVKLRVEKCKRIADDLKHGNRQRIDEVRNVEMQSVQNPDPAEVRYREVVLETRGWTPARISVPFQDPQGQIVTENLVAFAKRTPEDQLEWLTIQGQTATLNADLY